MKKALSLLLALTMCYFLFACSSSTAGTTTASKHTHDWKKANCTSPKTCITCGATKGTAKHNWQDATCTNPKTCSTCGVTEGSVIAHSYGTSGECSMCNIVNLNSIAYSSEGVEQFLNVVCKNVDGEYAKVIDPNYDGPSGSSCYTSRVEIKLTGKVADEVQMRFYNANSSDKVNWAQIIFYSFNTGSFEYVDYQHVFNCEKEFVLAVERTLTGTTYADEYLASYYDVKRLVTSPEAGETVTIAEYQLTDELMVTINVRNSGWSGNLFYIIKNISE